ncbi:TetR/AcrR family transcriptional regulator [Leucobacter sp. CSA2]|uniref:TetR/AcrR family transcriptional regulator n=1 Tax=Leucobacter edaphi TaxID=2796472 RepID=A0A934QE95_9MICO|nr:TetR/AcrR family transcriptional regulator [Leucobacter edaphi]MBK0422200.1 TetR/AcrR family transcriptional regulator [Leucobacter edaphi]
MNARESMIRAAASEMLADGYAGSSLASIAARIDLTKGALAREFPTKDLLAHEVLAAMATAIQREHAIARAEYPDSPARRLVRFLVGFDDSVRREVEVAAATSLLADRVLPAGMTLPPIDAWRAAVGEVVGEAHAAGDIPANVGVAASAQFLSVANLGNAVLEARGDVDGALERSRSILRLAMRAIELVDMERVLADVLGEEPVGPDLAAA